MKALEGKKLPVSQIRPDIPAGVVELVDRMMHVDPSQRFQDAGTVVRTIQELREHVATG